MVPNPYPVLFPNPPLFSVAFGSPKFTRKVLNSFKLLLEEGNKINPPLFAANSVNYL
jgi:hypothetical protein